MRIYMHTASELNNEERRRLLIARLIFFLLLSGTVILSVHTILKADRLGKMITDVIESSMGCPKVTMSEECWTHLKILREWMFQHVYLDPVTKSEEKKARNIVKSLYEYYTDKLTEYCDKDEIPQLVCDYISGMSDQYAIRRYIDSFIPKPLSEDTSDEALFKRIRDEIH